MPSPLISEECEMGLHVQDEKEGCTGADSHGQLCHCPCHRAEDLEAGRVYGLDAWEEGHAGIE